NPATPTGTVTVHYTDGTADTFTYNSPDWGSGAPSAALPTPVGRAQVGGGNTFRGTDPNSGSRWDLFETDIHPNPNKQVASLEFAAAGPNATGIFAVSGGTGALPVPVNTPFDVALVSLAPDNFDPVAASTVTFDGTNPVNQPFNLKE